MGRVTALGWGACDGLKCAMRRHPLAGRAMVLTLDDPPWVGGAGLARFRNLTLAEPR